VLRRRKVEAHGDFILGPVSPKEYKDTFAELNGSRTNRVFEFFKITPPEHVGFAKHREASEKKAAAVVAAEGDAEETATSPRAAPQKTGRRSAPAAATAAAEGKARKKRGGRPADSPPSPKRTRVVDLETGLVEDVIAAVPLRATAPSDAPSARAGKGAAGPLLVPLSPQEKDSDDDSDVRIVSSVGDAPRKPSPVALGAEAPQEKDDSSSTSTSSSDTSSGGIEQSASPSAPATEKDDVVAEAEEGEDEEPESSSYRVIPEEPRAAAVRLQVPAEAKLIGGKTIRFLGLTSGGHERQFLEEAGASFAIPHEEEYFGKLTAAELTTACGDLSPKAFIASRCLARRLEQESKESKERSVAAVSSLESRVAELEGRLAAEQERAWWLQQEKEDAAKSSEAVLKTLRHDMETLSSAKEDLHAQLADREAKLAEARKEASELSGALERYLVDHIRSAEALRNDILQLLDQCNLSAPPIPFPRCAVESYYEWVNACFDLISTNMKIFGELGAAVGVRTLVYSVCSLVPSDRPSSEKTISKSDLHRLTKENFEWPTDADLDIGQLPVLPKNLAKKFMNTFFAQRGYRLTLDESARLSAQVRRSYFCPSSKVALKVHSHNYFDTLPSLFCR
jgi:hypothetical protein